MSAVKRLLLLLVLVAALTVALATSASAKTVWGSNGCTKSERKPTLVAVTCADGKVRFETEAWEVWEEREARTAGYLHHPNLDDPSCANRPIIACPWVESPATIRLSEPAFCPGNKRWQFLRMRILAPEDVDPELREITSRFQCNLYATPKPPKRDRNRYWRDCGLPASYALKTVIAHRVNCVKARRLIRKVWRAGQEAEPGGVIHVKSFDCVLGGGNRPIACKRGPHRVRGPLPG